MSGRKLNPLEQKLHQAALADPTKTLSQKECDALVPDASARMAAINFLLGTGLFKVLKDTKGVVSFRAVIKKEMDVKKDMSGEENMILSHIQASGNEGIWTKHLKAKTGLHQTVIDRCLKSLTQKQLIKAVKNHVQFPTRKIYMLFHLEPSVEMTGGPWYTDNELDTEFIKLLCSACLRFVRDRSIPKKRSGADGLSARTQPIYSISAAPPYPTAQQVLAFLSKSRITETQLSVEHAEMLLNILVLDGEIEKLPAFGAALWESDMNAQDGQEDNDSEEDVDNESKKRKRKGKEKDGGSRSLKRKRSKKSRSSDSEDESESESESEDEKAKSRKKRRKGRDSETEDSDDEDHARRRERKKRKHRDEDSDDGSDNDSEDDRKSRRNKSKSKAKSKSKSKKRNHDSASESESDTESSNTASNDSARRSKTSRSNSKSKSTPKSSSKAKRSSSPVTADLSEGHGMEMADDYGSYAYVYRAIKQERAASGLAQAPCICCPTFDFCKTGGPVEATECVYYGDWLSAAIVGRE